MKNLFTVFMLLASITAFADAQRNQPEVVSASVDAVKKTITVRVSYGGGCEDHKFSLEIGRCLESYPVQCTAKVYDKTTDRCEALIRRNVSFSFEELGLNNDYFDGASINIIGAKKYDVETQKVVVTSANISLPQSNRLDEMFALPAVIANDRDAGKDDSSAQSSDTPSLTPGVILE
ncbi:MAG: hypothetical protein HON90_05855 [Halobacteriovoraceae bacterium]|jgi:hypothetical protein|nr:hypothetical protein [Halobacteriovoraceae bacterium]